MLVARKAEKAVSRRSPEKDNVLAYFGGHVREEDSTFLDNPTKLEVFKQCLYREVKEEIGIDIDPSDNNPFCIWVRDGSKSESHLTVVFVVERDLDNLKIAVDGEELVRYEKKGRIGTGAMLTGQRLLSEGAIDSWTRNIVEKIFGLSDVAPLRDRTLFE